MSNAEPLIQIEHIVKVYRREALKILVLNDINLKVPEGEYVVLMGPSGSGKTTILNLIAAIDQPTAGRIAIGGRDISKISQTELARWRSRTIGFIFQLYNLLPVLTAYENVELLPLTNLSKKVASTSKRLWRSGASPSAGSTTRASSPAGRTGVAGGHRAGHRFGPRDPRRGRADRGPSTQSRPERSWIS